MFTAHANQEEDFSTSGHFTRLPAEILALFFPRENRHASYPDFNILRDRHGTRNDRVDVRMQSHVLICSFD